MAKITQQRLMELLRFDPETGEFRWVVSRGSRAKAGAIAGTPDGAGYLQTRIDGVLYRQHKLAWLYVYGEYPEFQIDHIDHCRSNNAMINLRAATTSENNQNQISGRASNRNGLLGAHRRNGSDRWRASIGLDGKTYRLGEFASREEAHQAYLQAKKELHPFQTLVR